MVRKSLLVAIVLQATLTGCVARTYYYGKMDREAKPDGHEIQILLPGEPVPRPYEVLGIVQVDGYYATGTEKLIRGAQKKARKKGGDAIVLGPVGQKVVSYTLVVPGQPGAAAAAAAASSGGGAAAAAAVAPTPDRVIPAQVAWPTMSAIILAYTKE